MVLKAVSDEGAKDGENSARKEARLLRGRLAPMPPKGYNGKARKGRTLWESGFYAWRYACPYACAQPAGKRPRVGKAR